MLFNSYPFLLLFLPLCLGGFYLLKRLCGGRWAKVWLVAFSLWFYGYFNPAYLAIMLVSIAFNYAVFASLKRVSRRRLLVGVGIGCNLGLLFYFKYVDFFIENINALFQTALPLQGILLPLGISFFTFQQIGFLVDAYRGELSECGLLDYSLFVSFFPQLIAGPIVSHEEMLPQYAALEAVPGRFGRNRRKRREDAGEGGSAGRGSEGDACAASPVPVTTGVEMEPAGAGQDAAGRPADWDRLAAGVFLFVLGLVKKVLVADTFGVAVDWGYENISSMSGVDTLLVILFYSLQIYFDFSGYCDMARGVAWMLGFELPVNFDSPYQSRNVPEFWRRWHITLGRFFQKYVYFPLGGNRKGEAKTYRNIFIVFFLSGFWHGAGWTYVVWGLLHGFAQMVTRLCGSLSGRGSSHRHDAGRAPAGSGEAINSIEKSHERRGSTAAGRSGSHLLPRPLGVLLTYLFVACAFAVFRADDMGQAAELFGQLFTGGIALPQTSLTEAFNLDELWYVIKLLGLDALAYSESYLCLLITFITFLVVFFAPNADQVAEHFRPTVWKAVLTVLLAAWCILSLSEVSSFLYFNF